MDRMVRSSSVMEGHCEAKKAYPLAAADYKLLEEIGQGVSATVYRAICIPFNEVVAIKNLDLEKCSSNLDEIRREAQTVSLIGHPNVVRAYCSFVVDRSLYVVMPYLAGGSCLHVMKVAYPDGFEEPVIATVLRETLKALDYLHKHGHIHRDVKAGNILMDGQGGVKLGDFGVSACMFDTGDRQRSRNTFVGTPCWMAPEVMEQVHGYDFKADIWSFGITALELAHGHAPFSKYPPMKVLLMTLQNAPPGLDYERDKRFSKSFKEMIAMCLVKDPAKRPTAEKLLKHSFFKNARSNDYIAKHVLEGLPPLGERVKNLKLKDAARLAQKKIPYGEQEEMSQSEYKRGVSCWNFNVEDLKAGAALIHDDDSSPRSTTSHTQDEQSREVPKVRAERPLPNGTPADTAPLHPVNDHPRPHPHPHPQSVESNGAPAHHVIAHPVSDHPRPNPQLEEPSHTACQALPEEAGNRVSRPGSAASLVTGDGPGISNQSKEEVKTHSRREDRDCHKLENGEKRDCSKDHKDRLHSGFGTLERNLTGLRHRDDDKDYRTNIFYQNRALAGSSGALAGLSDGHLINGIPMVLRSSSYKDIGEEKVKCPPVVQKKGRFSVTEDVEMPESISQSNSGQGIPSSMLLPQLRTMLQQFTLQQDVLHHLISNINSHDGVSIPRLGHGGGSKNFSRTTSVGSTEFLGDLDGFRDRDQHTYIIELQNKLANVTDELQLMKLKNSQLEHRVGELQNQEAERIRKEGVTKENGQ